MADGHTRRSAQAPQGDRGDAAHPSSHPSPAAFYATVRGAVVARLLRARLARFWPDAAHCSVLGIGHAAPFLRLWRESAYTCVAGCPPFAASRWPPSGASLTCVIDDDTLPFPDLCFDRVVVIHGLELAGNARRLLREIWRVLRDDGRLVVVAPNRHGLWAHAESTPFGHGQPYTRAQIDQLLVGSLFCIERREAALFVPPVATRLMLRGAGLWEAAGRALVPAYAGVTITEATKDVFSAMPLTVRPKQAVRRGLVASP